MLLNLAIEILLQQQASIIFESLATIQISGQCCAFF
jgi:hypothetical protein